MDSNMGRRRFSDAGASLYTELELEKGAPPDAIKKSYRRLALRYHPDKNPGDNSAAEKFKELNRANRILSDPAKKAIYDQYGSLGLHIAENFGEENVKYYFLLTSWWCKALCGVCCIVTGCYFCCCCLCCCNCCCGKCGPQPEDEDIPDAADLAADMENEEGRGTPRSPSPFANGSSSPSRSPKTENTPIVLGPPPPYSEVISSQPKAGNSPIVLGPPSPAKSGSSPIVVRPPTPVSPNEKSELNPGQGVTSSYESTNNTK